MNKQQFINKLTEIRKQEKVLRAEYIQSNIIVPKNNIVYITQNNNTQKLYLYDYKIENNDIFVICFPIVYNPINDYDMIKWINYDIFNRHEKLNYKNRFKLKDVTIKLIETKLDNLVITYL